MLAVSRLSEDEVLQRLGTEVGFLTGVAHWDGQPFRLEPFQRAFLSQRSRYRCTVKSRQVGYSLIFAAEALARCHLRAGHTSIFISYNLDDAKEKIAYARQLHDELPAAFRKRLVVDKKTELAFASNAADGRISRIVSVPSKAPRGEKGDVYLDELAHYANDRQVYRGSTALTCARRASSPSARRHSESGGCSGRSPTKRFAHIPRSSGNGCRGGCAATSAPIP